MILTCGLLFITLASPGSALLSLDEDDKRCIIASHTNYQGDDYHVDLYIGDITYEDDQLYLNGEPFQNAVEKRISKLLSQLENGSNPIGDPPGNGHGNGNGPPPHHHLNKLTPVLNLVVKGVVGPALEAIEDLDPEDPPVVQFEVRLPSDTEEVDGARIALIVNTPICLSETEL